LTDFGQVIFSSFFGVQKLKNVPNLIMVILPKMKRSGFLGILFSSRVIQHIEQCCMPWSRQSWICNKQ